MTDDNPRPHTLCTCPECLKCNVCGGTMFPWGKVYWCLTCWESLAQDMRPCAEDRLTLTRIALRWNASIPFSWAAELHSFRWVNEAEQALLEKMHPELEERKYPHGRLQL